MKVECKNCNGKGHVLDGSTLLLPVFGWLLAAAERNNKEGFTRERCEHCNGKGYIKI